MAYLSKNDPLDNAIEALAPRIEVNWNPRDDSGEVKFFFEKFDYRPSDWYLNERAYLATLTAPLSAITAESYSYVHPVTGEAKTVDGPEVVAIVKAITDRRWELSQPAAAPAAGRPE